MNQKSNFESNRYPNEVSVSTLTHGLAWLLWAILGVFFVAGTLATNGLLAVISLVAVLSLIGIRLFLTFCILHNTILLKQKTFPNLSAIVHGWKLAMEDPYHAQVFLGGPGNDIRILPGLKRPVIVIPDSILSALTAAGTLDEAQFALTQALAHAKLTYDWEWYIHLPLYLSFPTILLPLWLARLRTLSADRIALAVTQHTQAGIRAVFITTIGPLLAPRIESSINIGKQWPQTPWLAMLLHFCYATPPLSDRIENLGQQG